MGQAQMATANDSGAVNYNPACLVMARERWDLKGLDMWLQLGQSGYAPYLRLNGIDQNYPYTVYTLIGTVFPLGKRLTAGLNISNANDWLLVVALAHGPSFIRYTPTQQPTGSLGLGLKITDKLSVGYTMNTTLHINASTIPVDINAILAGIGITLGDPAININPNVEIDVLSGTSYQFGALYRPFKWLSLGANYTYKNGSEVYIPVYLPPGLLPETTIYVEGWVGSTPSQIGFGVGIYPNEHITVAFDMDYDMWSRTHHWLRFRSSDPDFLNTDFPEIELEDVWVPKFGLEYRGRMPGKFSRAEYSLRAGYLFYKSPWPPMGTDPQDIDNDAHNFSGGFALGYYPKHRHMAGLKYLGIDYFWEYIYMVERDHRDLSRQPAVIVSDGYVIYTGLAFTVKI
jgi:long-subunit fatty acid transport protein